MKYKINLLTLLLIGTVHTYANIHLPQEDNSTKNHEDIALPENLKALKEKNKILEAELKLKELTQKNQTYTQKMKEEEKLKKLQSDAKLAEAKSKKLTFEMKLKQTEWELKTKKLEREISMFKIKQERSLYTNNQPLYLENPLKKDNTLIISDRRISLNGLITSKMAQEITTKINYYNNKDNTQPIFLVIDSSPGGSVMAGYLILKAMESSNAPVYVVLKSFAASMAAIIVTFADKSFAYSHATMLHHQPSAYVRGSSNLTEQKENYKNLEKWWNYLGTPIAKKMGISIDAFQKQMYKNSSKGDWSEFAIDAQKLKWVNHIVSRIEDTSIQSDIIEKQEKKKDKDTNKHAEIISKDGKPINYLPHLAPTDVYFLYSPDGFYQRR